MKKPGVLFLFSLLTIELMGQSDLDSVFSSSEIILHTSTGDIYGTLTVPSDVKKSPVVLLIAGSGPTDRNCNSPAGLKTNAYKMLAEGLAGKGISTLRYDKRGIGESSPAMIKESDLRFETYVADAEQWIALLEKDRRFSKHVILGHSEGSLIGLLAAEHSDIEGFISIAGVGRPADQVLRDQLKGKLPPPLSGESDKILDSLRAGKTVANVNPNLFSLYRPSVQPYMISWIKYDPAQEIGKLKIPVLIIQGTTDLQVSVNDAKLLAASKPGTKLVLVDNMNHVMKDSDGDVKTNMSTYRDPELPLKDGLVEDIVNFIKSGRQ